MPHFLCTKHTLHMATYLIVSQSKLCGFFRPSFEISSHLCILDLGELLMERRRTISMQCDRILNGYKFSEKLRLTYDCAWFQQNHRRCQTIWNEPYAFILGPVNRRKWLLFIGILCMFACLWLRLFSFHFEPN